MRLSPPPQVPETQRSAEMLGELTEVLPQFGRWVGLAQVVQAHFIVSASGSKFAPSSSVVWNKPRKCPVSCAPMYATRSGPQPAMFGLAPQLDRLPAKRSAPETTAPLLTVPFMDEGPGIVPSIPTMVLPPEL